MQYNVTNLGITRSAETATKQVVDSSMTQFVGEALQGVDDEKRAQTYVKCDHRHHLEKQSFLKI